VKFTLESSGYSDERLARSALSILESTELCSMATITPKGESYIHTAYFCYNETLDIFSISDPSTQHGQNLAKSPTMAMAVASSNQPWDEPHRGLQLFGRCHVATLAESAKAFKIHAARFHAYGEYIKSLNPLELKVLTYKFYIFSPEIVKIFDEPEFGEEVFITAVVRRR
jgi:uncharacterized protein YhbP (UPF0306 family)